MKTFVVLVDAIEGRVFNGPYETLDEAKKVAAIYPPPNAWSDGLVGIAKLLGDEKELTSAPKCETI